MNTQRSKFIRSADIKSTAWKNVERQINEDLAEARAKLESIATDHDQTLIQRGRIAALRQLLAHASKPAEDPDRPSRRDRVTAEDLGDD